MEKLAVQNAPLKASKFNTREGGLRKTLKWFLLCILLGMLGIAAAYFWRYSPTHVHVNKIERGMITADSVLLSFEAEKYCAHFTLTPTQFEEFFLLARPIFDVDVHDYHELPCFYRETEGGKEYRVFEGGLGWIKKGADKQWFGLPDQRSVLENSSEDGVVSKRRDGAPYAK